jgi:hypothetical protein
VSTRGSSQIGESSDIEKRVHNKQAQKLFHKKRFSAQFHIEILHYFAGRYHHFNIASYSTVARNVDVIVREFTADHKKYGRGYITQYPLVQFTDTRTHYDCDDCIDPIGVAQAGRTDVPVSKGN